MRAATGLCLDLALGLAVPALALDRTPAPPDARVYILAPSDGERVRGLVSVRFGLVGMGVAPAEIGTEHTGHHHPLIDVAELPPPDEPIPAYDQHRHFGGGQTEIVVELPPGERTLQLVLGDHNHVPRDPPAL